MDGLDFNLYFETEDFFRFLLHVMSVVEKKVNVAKNSRIIICQGQTIFPFFNRVKIILWLKRI